MDKVELIKTVKKFSLFIAIPSLIVSVILKVLLFDKDDFIIRNGIAATKAVSALNLIAIIIFVISIIAFIVTSLMKTSIKQDEIKRDKIEKETNVFYHERDLVLQLNKGIETAPRRFADLGNKMLSQLNEMNDGLNDFETVTDGYDYPIINSVKDSLISSKLQMLENLKSTSNRIIVEAGEDEIQERIDQNVKMLSEIKDLVLESVNYIDNKSNKTHARLDTLTESLKEINDSIK